MRFAAMYVIASCSLLVKQRLSQSYSFLNILGGKGEYTEYFSAVSIYVSHVHPCSKVLMIWGERRTLLPTFQHSRFFLTRHNNIAFEMFLDHFETWGHYFKNADRLINTPQIVIGFVPPHLLKVVIVPIRDYRSDSDAWYFFGCSFFLVPTFLISSPVGRFCSHQSDCETGQRFGKVSLHYTKIFLGQQKTFRALFLRR